MCIGGYICPITCVEVRIQLERISSFPSLCRSQGLNSGLQGLGSKRLYLLNHPTTAFSSLQSKPTKALSCSGTKEDFSCCPMTEANKYTAQMASFKRNAQRRTTGSLRPFRGDNQRRTESATKSQKIERNQNIKNQMLRRQV